MGPENPQQLDANVVVARFALHYKTSKSGHLGEAIYPEWMKRMTTRRGIGNNFFGVIIDSDLNMPPPTIEQRHTMLKNAATHEFGHLIGLKDALSSCSSADTIMARGSWTRSAALTVNDKTALALLLKVNRTP